LIREFRQHTDAINAVAVPVDGSRLATGGLDNQAMIWDIATGKLLTTLTGHTDDVLAMAFVPSVPQFVTAGRDPVVRL
jgi:WD40 repeat protein